MQFPVYVVLSGTGDLKKAVKISKTMRKKPSTCKTDAKVQGVKQMIGGRRLTIRIIADELNINRDCLKNY